MTDTQNQNVSLSNTLRGRVVVADTSSLLIAGTHLIDDLSECRLVIPAVVVTELEDKRTHATLGFLAREWLRLIEQYRVSHPDSLRTGVTLDGSDEVTLQIEPNHTNQKSLPKQLQTGTHDSTILAVANNLREEGKDVVLLSNDMPMRIHATIELNIDAIEYTSNITDPVGKVFQGRFDLDLQDEEDLVTWSADDGISNDVRDKILANLPDDAPATSFTEVLVAGKNTRSAVIVSNGDFTKVKPKTKAFGITGKTVEQDVLIELLKKPADELPIVSIGGSAGTGKTLLTIAVALEELKYHHYEKVVIFRSLHEMGEGQEMGFLPGSVEEKMGPWAGAIHDALDTLARVNQPLKKNPTLSDYEKQKAEAKKYREMIQVEPITYLRGRSLANTFMVLEEAQNFSKREILNILSRAGMGTKIVLTFDANQIDNRFLKAGKDADIWSVVNHLKDTDVFAHITLTRTERSRVAEIASRILEEQF